MNPSSNRRAGTDGVIPTIARGRYLVRPASGSDDVIRAQALRHLCFHGREGIDRDGMDALCHHVLVEERRGGRTVGCFRLRPFGGEPGAEGSYAAGVYDLSPLRDGFDGAMTEIGRFCVHPEVEDADVLRLAWGALAEYVEGRGIGMLFGCASFPGTDPGPHADVFAWLAARHLGPPRRRPGIKAPEVVRFAELTRGAPEARVALLGLPPLLRSYLAMGGWVGDHAVVDRAMGTLHVFTAVEIDRIPQARRRLLRALAG